MFEWKNISIPERREFNADQYGMWTYTSRGARLDLNARPYLVRRIDFPCKGKEPGYCDRKSSL